MLVHIGLVNEMIKIETRKASFFDEKILINLS